MHGAARPRRTRPRGRVDDVLDTNRGLDRLEPAGPPPRCARNDHPFPPPAGKKRIIIFRPKDKQLYEGRVQMAGKSHDRHIERDHFSRSGTPVRPGEFPHRASFVSTS
jgi:hypothetical protein